MVDRVVKLRLGLIPRQAQGDAHEREFVVTLARALGAHVDVHRAPDYRVVVTGFEQGVVDFAWLPPLVAARALRNRLADPVAVAMRSGTTTYCSALVAQPESRFRSLADLDGVRVAWVDRESASGYVVVRAALARAGVKLTEAFRHETFARSHAAVVRAVREGDVDVGATCIHPGSAAAGDLRVFYEAGPIPSDIFAVRHGVASAIRSVIETVLLGRVPERAHAAACALMQADGFVSPTMDHRRMLGALAPA
jgi:phosphate/phosphite/phosphonate ABC transporter binding protein